MEEEIQSTPEEVEDVIVEAEPEQQEETPEPEEQPERRQETPEAKRARLQRELDRLNKKFPTEKPTSKKINTPDYAELAYLAAKGIDDAAEIEFVKKISNTSGLSLQDTIKDEFVQAKLKSMREAAAVEDAVPRGTKRSNTQARDNVDYWIAKGELPEDVDLRRKVVNERIKRETQKNVFGA